MQFKRMWEQALDKLDEKIQANLGAPFKGSEEEDIASNDSDMSIKSSLKFKPSQFNRAKDVPLVTNVLSD